MNQLHKMLIEAEKKTAYDKGLFTGIVIGIATVFIIFVFVIQILPI